MNQIIKNNIQPDLLGKREEIVMHVDALIANVETFLSKHRNALSERNMEDMQVIQKSAVEMKNKVNKILTSEALDAANNNVEDFTRFLAKIRHDLHNSINIIMGYSELLLTDFQKRKMPDVSQDFSTLVLELNQTTKLTNEIKSHEVATVNVDKYVMTEIEKDIEFEEFDLFKKKLSVLVVDDVQENCRILERYLKELGFEKITSVYDGLQTLKLLKKKKFDLLLLDIDMPNVNGKEVMALVKEDLIEQKYSIIVISGSDNMEDTVECIRLGAEDMITKPFNPDLLRVRINSCIERKWFKYKENIYRMKYELVKKNLMRGYYALNFLYFLWKI